MKGMKLWPNVWAASQHMHGDSILDCVLGCTNAADSLIMCIVHMCSGVLRCENCLLCTV